MPNLAGALKTEIARVARKEIKGDIEALKRLVTQQRRLLARLRNRVEHTERLLRKSRTATQKEAAADQSANSSDTGVSQLRFSAKGFANLRQRLGISAAAMGRLIDASPLSVYKWESGKTHPRAKQIEKIAAVRTLGKREVGQRLGGEATKVDKATAKASRNTSRLVPGRKRAAASA